MTALRRLRAWLTAKLPWSRGHIEPSAEAVSVSLAHDLGVPAEVMSRIMDETNAELRALAAVRDDLDARPVINKAIREVQRYHDELHADLDDAVMVRFLDELPDRDYTILSYRAQGLSPTKIAKQMGMDVESVRRVLQQTHVEMRSKTGGFAEERPRALM